MSDIPDFPLPDIPRVPDIPLVPDIPDLSHMRPDPLVIEAMFPNALIAEAMRNVNEGYQQSVVVAEQMAASQRILPRDMDYAVRDLGAELRENVPSFLPSAADRTASSVEEVGRQIRKHQNAHSAKARVRRLLEQVRRFEKRLNDDMEVGVRLVSFTDNITFHVEELGAIEPDVVIFRGHTDDGAPIHLYQDISRLSFALMALPRVHPEEPRRRIGFFEESDEE
jgi:hypothetical protein